MGARRATAICVVLLASVLAACGGDDSSSDPGESSTSATSASGLTSGACGDGTPQVIQASGWCERRSEIAAHAALGPQCVYREGELLVKESAVAAIDDLLRSRGASVTRGPSLDFINYRLIRYENGPDPVDVASTNDETFPNYLISFAMGWTFVPGAPATHVTGLTSAAQPLTPTTPHTITVLDTAWETKGLPVTVETDGLPRPGSIDTALHDAERPPTSSTPDVDTGLAAGHGTFIASMLRQLFTDPAMTTIKVGQVPSWVEKVDNSGMYETSITDSFAVALAVIYHDLDATDFVNMSLGTYGCPDDVIIDGERNRDWRAPVPVAEAIRHVHGESQSSVQFFAAAGNDYSEEPFYPAAWAACDGPAAADVHGCVAALPGQPPIGSYIRSVGSEPCVSACGTMGVGAPDFSNLGDWVEHVTVGAELYGVRPPTKDSSSLPPGTNPSGFYKWTGTSFATPCAIALAIMGTLLPKSEQNPRAGDCGLSDAPRL